VKQPFDMPSQLAGVSSSGKAPYAFALAVDQEFGEIPLDPRQSEPTRSRCLEVLKQGVCIRAGHTHLAKQRKRHLVSVDAKVLNLLVVMEFLMQELIAGKTQYRKPLFPVIAVQQLQPAVLGG